MVALLAVLAVLGSPTAKVVVMPFDGSLVARGIAIEKTVRGACTSGSEIARRWDAWSCRSVGGLRLDPCFSGRRRGAGAMVVCLRSPWEQATLLELKSPLPEALANVVGDPRTHAPWALALANGERCELSTANLGRAIGGERVNYVCAGAAVLTGLPDRSHRVWTIRRAATVTASRVQAVAIRTAYW